MYLFLKFRFHKLQTIKSNTLSNVFTCFSDVYRRISKTKPTIFLTNFVLSLSLLTELVAHDLPSYSNIKYANGGAFIMKLNWVGLSKFLFYNFALFSILSASGPYKLGSISTCKDPYISLSLIIYFKENTCYFTYTIVFRSISSLSIFMSNVVA